MNVAALTHHGGRLDAAMSAYPHAPTPWLDLSTGINPEPWTPAAPIDVDLARLPSIADLRMLEATAADYFGTAAESVLAVPGSEIALRLLGRIGLPAPFAHVAPGYRTHGAMCAASTPVALPYDGGGTLVFANPDNPTGRLLSREEIRGARGAGWLILDEAFIDCSPEASVIPDLPERTIVLRSFGKFFGLAGLRLGFVVGPAEILTRLRALLGDWPISAPALAYGLAAYGDAAWIGAARVELGRKAAALDAVLARHDLCSRGDCPLFRLVESDRPVFDQLARAGILSRPFDYDPRWIRIGLPTRESDLIRLDRALASG